MEAPPKSNGERDILGQRRERPQIAGVHQPLIARRPGDHHRAQPRGSGDRSGAGEGLNRREQKTGSHLLTAGWGFESPGSSQTASRGL